ncbi:hypothetical protein D3C71_2153760 [compost metagenome]
MVELAKNDVHRLLQCAPELEKTKVQMEDLVAKCMRLQTTSAKAQARIFWAQVGAVALFVALLFATAQGKLSWHLS